MVGAMVAPATKPITPKTMRLGENARAAKPIATAPVPTTVRIHNGVRKCLAPYSSPPVSEPRASAAINTPAMALKPRSSAKPTAEMSSAPNMSPSPSEMSVTPSTAAGILSPRLTPPVSLRRGGSVAVWESNMTMPMSEPTVHTTKPAPGHTAVARMVARAGPPMKSTSSRAPSSAKAEWISLSVLRMLDQRARVREPSGPLTDAMATAIHSIHSGPRVMAVHSASAAPVTYKAVSGIMAARCPKRSAKRAVGTVCSAHTRTPIAATRPAISYELY